MNSNIVILLALLYLVFDYVLYKCKLSYLKRVVIGTIWFSVFLVLIGKDIDLTWRIFIIVFFAYIISAFYNLIITDFSKSEKKTEYTVGDKVATVTDRFFIPIIIVGGISACFVLGFLFVENKTQLNFNNDIKAEYTDINSIPDNDIVKAKLESIGYHNVSVCTTKDGSRYATTISATKNWQDMNRTIFVSIK